MPGYVESKDTLRTVIILLQKVLPDVDEGSWAAVCCEFRDEGFGLLDEEFEGGGGGLS
jgi:hypothetical protein